MLDAQGRNIHYLRVSVTDRCDLRCQYCMPEGGVAPVDHCALLTYEETGRLVRLSTALGVDKIRLTGGEPLVRRGLDTLVAMLKAIDGVRAVALTTNAVQLKVQLPGLLRAGLDQVNISLDALDPARYAAITRRDALPQALAGLEAALAAPGLTVKLNCVAMEANSDQLVPLAALAKDRPLWVRFIELMPIGMGASMTGLNEAAVLSRLESAFGPATAVPPPPEGGPARYVTFPGFVGRVGFISPLSHQFCSTCDRVRLTSTGFFKTCLQYDRGVDLKALLDAGAEDEVLLSAMRRAVWEKPLCHHFGTPGTGGDEGRNMNQIGG